MFKRYSGKTKVMWLPKAASTAFSKGALVYPNGLGQVIPADSTSGCHVGVIQRDVASTDSDYASTSLVPVEVPVERWTEWVVDASSAVAADVLTEIDLTDSLNANRSASSKDALLVTGIISASKIRVVILSAADNKYTATT